MILVKGLSKQFEGHQVLRSLNLEVEKGETMVVMGRSGCGKSVLLKLIMGLLEPDEGEIWVDGQEITDLTEKQMDQVRKRFGMVFQSSALFDSLTVGENVGFSLSRHTDMDREQVGQVVGEKLQLVGLRGIEEVMPVDLSGGMKKRVSLARAISMDPEIILYDEPTTGLDPITADEINRLIAELHARLKVTSIVVTHDMKSAFSVGTKMAMLHDGKIIASGTPGEFRENTEPIVRGFLAQEALDVKSNT
jgi:phospholipid/cholesterol/gamma-HCH transport system ATP-binding protein